MYRPLDGHVTDHSLAQALSEWTGTILLQHDTMYKITSKDIMK